MPQFSGFPVWCFVLCLGWLACGQSDPPPPPPPAAPTATSDKETLRARHSALFQTLRNMVDELKESGRYDCCIQTPCSHCAMMVGGCSCGEGLRRGEPVCEECALMWMRGLGDETGIDPATVRSFLEAERIINAKAAAHSKGATKGASKAHAH